MRPVKALAVLILTILIGSAAAVPALAQAQPVFEDAPRWVDWRIVFKLIDLTTHAEPGDLGFLREGDDTRGSNELSLRVQLTGQPADWLSYRLDYRNVRQTQDTGLFTDRPAETDLFRRRSWRKFLERPETAPGQNPSTQTTVWFHEIDHALAKLRAGPLDAVLGRQPITWGAGRIWQPTDLFASFGPLALDTEYKPGVDAMLLSVSLSDFSVLSLAYVLSRQTPQPVEDSTVLHWRTQVGQESELTLLAGALREESLAGGSLETVGLGAGWRLEALFFEPREFGPAGQLQDSGETEAFAIAGVDLRLSGGIVLLAEWYYHTLGAADEGELRRVVGTLPFLEGRLLQLSRHVLAVGAADELGPLWSYGYTLFTGTLRDAQGERHGSVLHQLALTYSVSDESEAVFSLTTANGRGLADDGSFRSEFGHVPDAFYVSIQVVF